MKISLLANAGLAPILDSLCSLSPHLVQPTLLSDIPSASRREIRLAAENAFDCDAIVLLDGSDILSECGWHNGDIPFVIPRVHNIAALLLGDDDEYRRLFTLYDGGISWFLPGAKRETCFTPREDCQALCALTLSQLEIGDTTLTARAIAGYQGWDYLEHPCDLSLIESLLGGDWTSSEAAVIQPGKPVLPL